MFHPEDGVVDKNDYNLATPQHLPLLHVILVLIREYASAVLYDMMMWI